MSKQAITISFDTDHLTTHTDEYLVTLWFLAQANPVGSEDEAAGRIAEEIGREIIRRFVTRSRPPLWNHQGKDFYLNVLIQNGEWENGVWKPKAKEGAQ